MADTQVPNLYFYNKNGYPYSFEKIESEDGSFYYKTHVYIDPLSTNLFDCENIFVLQNIDGEYYFPQISENEQLVSRWSDLDDDPEFFLFDVLYDSDTNTPYISKIKNAVLNSSGVDRVGDIPSKFSGKSTYQINVAFSPKEEEKYERILDIFYQLGEGSDTAIAHWQFCFYGEGIEEDERFKVHLENFGIKFNRTDALCLKNYDIKEALPDWEEVNLARKSIFINKEEIFPYVGTYYGLKNILMVLGYSDELDIKEYWRDISANSRYKGKYILTSVADLLDDGEVNNSTRSTNNGDELLKDSENYIKTGLLALCYEFNKKTGEYDENETPIMERTTKFTSSEIFYKLHGLKKILQSEYLPVHVQIKDLIGEFTYYISFSKLVWKDKLSVQNMKVNEEVKFTVYPDGSKTYIRNLYKFSKYFNTPLFDKYETPAMDQDQSYPKYPEMSIPYMLAPEVQDKVTQLPGLGGKLTDDMIPHYIDFINRFYNPEETDLGYPTGHNGPRDIFDSVSDLNDDFSSVINEKLTSSETSKYSFSHTYGCPVILIAELEDFIITDLATSQIFKFNTKNLNSTVAGLKYRDFYEIEWGVYYAGYNNDLDGKTRYFDYKFEYRTSIEKGMKLPVFLPYEGYYDVYLKMISLTGNVSKCYSMKRIEVKTNIPTIAACYTGDDVFSFKGKDLHNIRVKDFNSSPMYNPTVNILKTSDEPFPGDDIVSSSVISSFEESAEYYDVETKTWVKALGNNDQITFGDGNALRVSDFSEAKIYELFHLRPIDTVLTRDVRPGFTIDSSDIKNAKYIKFGYTDESYEGNEYKIITLPKYKNDLAKYCSDIFEMEENFGNVFLNEFEVYPTHCDKIGEGGEYNQVVFSAKSSSTLAFQFYTIYDKNWNPIVENALTFVNPTYGFGEDAVDYGFTSKGIPEAFVSLNVPYEDIARGEATNPKYYDDKRYYHYIKKDSEYGPSYYKCGTLPVIMNSNYINPVRTKISRSSFVIPKFKYVIFFVEGIGNQVEFLWRLYDNLGNLIVSVRNTPYFIYRFDKVGSYSVTYVSKDVAGNDYMNDRFGLITVMGKDEYIDYTASEISKAQLNN